MGKAKKIFFGNYKGGVGKTTSVYYISHYLANYGKKVLLIDLDPQCSLSEVCMKSLDRRLDDLKDDESLNYVFDIYMQAINIHQNNIVIDTNKLIKKCKLNNENIDFIPSNLFYPTGENYNKGLDELAIQMAKQQGGLEQLTILHNFIQASNLDEKYDLIIFDCPPTNNLITQSGFLTSDYYIVPTIMDEVSVKGVLHYCEVIQKCYEEHCNNSNYSQLARLIFGDKPKLLGVFETMRKGSSHPRGKGHLSEYKQYETVIKDLNPIADNMSKGYIRDEQGRYNLLTEEIIKDLYTCKEGVTN
jgi:chromosome partitioning protein